MGKKTSIELIKKGKSSARPSDLAPETKRSILIVLFFALSAILFLSLFNLAGTIGNTVDQALRLVFGLDRFLVPLLFIVSGVAWLIPDWWTMRSRNVIGTLFFFLSFNAAVNLVWFQERVPTDPELMMTGGYIGQFLGTILPHLVGFWASLILLIATLLVSLLLTFNTSLGSLFFFPTALRHPLRLLKREPKFKNREEEDEFIEETDEEPFPKKKQPLPEKEAADTTTKPITRPLASAPVTIDDEPDEEKVLTTKNRRKMNLSLDFLAYQPTKPNSGDIERNKEIIRRTFEQFGIPVEMAEISTGPAVTQYTFRPAEGIKVARIVSLQNDLALALAAHPLRIEAPIPGKSLVGVEIPNLRIATVSLRELLEAPAFKERTSQTALALGKDVSGKVWVTYLERMPHLLVAGSTGSGKSVCLNTLITALLYQNGPDELKFIMIDPKRVELTVYAGIPHLLVPPITKVEETIHALKWTVREMERRLDVLSKFGVRDIDSYNKKTEDKMPRIVVVIDELADLMIASGHEVETTIIRIAQMARAVGIHLILATQRPSVDVITGTIKANFPARIAFAVASQTDSRTILDMAGAEKLIGRGDMLFINAELSKPKRIQGAFIAETEIGRLVDALKQEEAPDYNYSILEKQKSETMFGGEGEEDQDPLFDEAVPFLIQSKRASTSLLQRRFKIGYSRAARLIDQLEEQGIIGPGDGAKPREILVTEWSSLWDSVPAAPTPAAFDQKPPSAYNDILNPEEKDPEIDEDTIFLEAQEGEYLNKKT